MPTITLFTSVPLEAESKYSSDIFAEYKSTKAIEKEKK